MDVPFEKVLSAYGEEKSKRKGESIAGTGSNSEEKPAEPRQAAEVAGKRLAMEENGAVPA